MMISSVPKKEGGLVPLLGGEKGKEGRYLKRSCGAPSASSLTREERGKKFEVSALNEKMGRKGGGVRI